MENRPLPLRACKQIFKYVLLFHIGGSLYYYIEVFSRGWSHWSMYLLGAACFLFCSIQNEQKCWEAPLWRQVLRCDVFVLCGEFVTGCMVNLWKDWHIWDYSAMPFNLMGQICLPMALVFAFLCLCGIVLDDVIRWQVFEEEKPAYFVKRKPVRKGI